MLKWLTSTTWSEVIAASVAVVLMLALLAIGTASADIGFAAEKTVRQWTDGNNSCSVVVIAPDVALTAAHCAQLAVFGATVQGLAVAETVVAPNGQDVAMLRVPGLQCPCAKPASDPVTEGDAVVVVGFPYGLPTRVTTEGKAQGRFLLPEDGNEYVVATVDVKPGNSGGGVFNSDGLLLGIVSRGDSAGLLLYVELVR